MWLIYFVTAFNWSVTGNLAPYILSDFEAHSLVTVIGIVSGVLGAALYMPIAKMLNLFDRSYGFLFLVFLSIVGLITSAVCQNVQTYAASQVFTTVGFTGMILSIDILTADTSHLKNRGLAYAYTSSPYIITTFAGPKIAEHFHESNWRWAFGTVAIMLPVVAAPMFFMLQKSKRNAIAQGKLVVRSVERSWLGAIKHYLIEFDSKSICSLGLGFALIGSHRCLYARRWSRSLPHPLFHRW
jgi:MFS family permease